MSRPTLQPQKTPIWLLFIAALFGALIHHGWDPHDTPLDLPPGHSVLITRTANGYVVTDDADTAYNVKDITFHADPVDRPKRR